MAEPAARPSSLINTLYGAFVRRLGGWISIADLIVLMDGLGTEPQTVRSAISRLKKRGDLVQERRGTIGYRLSDTALPMFDEGDRRIFRALEPARLEDGWVLAVFSVPEAERTRRHRLRTCLARLGFGNIAPGVWIAPARTLEDSRHAFERFGLTGYIHLFATDYAGFAELRASVGSWWDLKAIELQYASFTEAYRPLATHLKKPQAIDNTQAFRDYLPMLTQWRRLPYLDPGLPPELLPPDWNAVEARHIFITLQQRLVEPALHHVQKVTGLEPISSSWPTEP